MCEISLEKALKQNHSAGAQEAAKVKWKHCEAETGVASVWVHRHKQSTLRYKNNNEDSVLLWDELFFTRLSVVHPAQDDLRGSVPTSHHVPRHLAVGLPRQTKVQDLNRTWTGDMFILLTLRKQVW